MPAYYFTIGTGNPQNFAAFSPSFISFCKFDGSTLAPPGITQPTTNQGLFQFTYSPSFVIAFIIDGGASIAATSGRYVSGSLSPLDYLDTTLNAIGNTAIALGTTTVALGTTTVALGTTAVSWGSATGSTLVAQGSTVVAIGNTLAAIGTTLSFTGNSLLGQINSKLGTTSSVFGDSVTDPSDLFGYLKRIQELMEGNQTYTKGSGSWLLQARGGLTTLITKTIAQSASLVTRS